MEVLNEQAVRAKVNASFREPGPYFKNFINPVAGLHFEDAPAGTLVNHLSGGKIPQQTPVDTWFSRRNK
jgi:hypothetical protein